MEEKNNYSEIYRFAEFELLRASERLMKGGHQLKIEPQLYALLWLFVQNPGVLISRERIEQVVWDGRPTTDEAIRAALKKLRDLLEDDARVPRFIKTIPKQGYKWLAPIKQNKVKTHSHFGSMKKTTLFTACLLTLVLILAIFKLAFDSGKEKQVLANTQVLTQLTQLTGSEVDASYNPSNNKLAFIHRDTRNSPQQLYLKSLDDELVTRLSWDQANYSDAYWSRDGSKLVFMRLFAKTSNIHIAHFNQAADITQLETLTTSELQDKFVIGWLQDDKGLLLAEAIKPNKKHSIYAYLFADEKLQRLTTPNVAGYGDYKAALSENGELIAILRQEVAQQSSLLVMSLATGDLLAKTALPFIPSRLIWTPNDKAIAMSNFYGEHGRYNLKTKQLESQPVLPENSLDLFAACGERCYILRQHNGNFLDLQETPLASLAVTEQTMEPSPVIDTGRLLRRSNAQDFPQYLTLNQGLFFVSLKGKQLVFQQLSKDNKVRDIATLVGNKHLDTVSVSPDNSELIGISGGRLFSAAMQGGENQAVTFITSALERFENPVWSEDSSRLYMAKIIENQAEIVSFELETRQIKTVAKKLLAFSPRPNKADEAIGITPDLSVVRLLKKQKNWQQVEVLGAVTSANPNRWKLTQDIFYYTKHQLPEAFLCKISLQRSDSAQQETCWSIGNNRFRLNFDINNQSQKAILVESLSAESDIIKLEW